MRIFALADLHLSFGVPDKSMDIFGERWLNHPERIKKHWLEAVQPEDLVLLPGDISWAIRLEAALPDLEWIDKLPGTKVMIRGNHDYWWSSPSKMRAILPPSLHLLNNDSIRIGDVEIGGVRLWDADDFGFDGVVEMRENPKASHEPPPSREEDMRIYLRELGRLELSLKSFKEKDTLKIAMTHYPPVDGEMHPSKASLLLEQYGVKKCAFGHLHNVPFGKLPYGSSRGIEYYYVAGDYTDFHPVRML